jgi:flagellar hook-basal body complex protein FliE
MDVKQVSGVNAYNQAAKNLEDLGEQAGSSGVAQTGSAFADLVSESIGNVREATQASELTGAQALAGKADLVDVVTSVSNAEMVVDTVVAVRDRVISAYNDILKMPI